MKQSSKFKRWFLGLFGGVLKSDYDIVVEQRDNFIGDVKINDLRIKSLEQENELLKKQITYNPRSVIIETQKAKIKEIKRFAAIGPLPLEQTEFCLRDAVLMEVAPFIKIKYEPSTLIATAALRIVENEEDMQNDCNK